MILGVAEIMREIGRSTSLTRQTDRGLPGGQARTEAIRRVYGEKRQKTKAPQKMRCAFVPGPAVCECCGGDYFRRRSWQRTCSRDCQLILWAAETFFRAYREGRADGLRPVIEELKA